MSLLIKGMDMPDKCIECWNCDKNFVDKDLRSIDNWMCLVEMRFVLEVGTYARPEWCPLVEVLAMPSVCVMQYQLAILKKRKLS